MYNPTIPCHPEDDGLPFEVPLKISCSWCVTELFLAAVFSGLLLRDRNIHPDFRKAVLQQCTTDPVVKASAHMDDYILYLKLEL